MAHPTDKSRQYNQIRQLATAQAGESILIECDNRVALHFAARQGIPVTTRKCLLIEEYDNEQIKTTRITKVIRTQFKMVPPAE